MRDTEVYVSPPKGKVLVASLDVRHLAVLMFERFAEITHPDHMTLDEAADEIKQRSPDIYQTMVNQAHVALEYFEAAMRTAKPERQQ